MIPVDIMYNFILCMNKKKIYLSDLHRNIYNYFKFRYIYPQRLVMIKSICNFCNKEFNSIFLNQISLNYGYINCRNCKDISNYNLKYHCKLNKIILWRFVLNNLKLEFNVPRSKRDHNGNKIVEKWMVNEFENIKYHKKSWYLPFREDNRILEKYISLNEFIKYNDCENSRKIINFIKNY